MAAWYQQKWCEHDQKYVLAIRDELQHMVHGLIAGCTLGLWLPVWLVLTLTSSERFYCQESGRPTVDGPLPLLTRYETSRKAVAKPVGPLNLVNGNTSDAARENVTPEGSVGSTACLHGSKA
jgi:hypothetical protein